MELIAVLENVKYVVSKMRLHYRSALLSCTQFYIVAKAYAVMKGNQDGFSKNLF